MQTYEQELAVASAAAREAGAIARGLQAGIISTAKDDGSPVTQADLAADACIRHHLQLHFPGDAILSEELADRPERLANRRVWIVDPIDGTRQFAAGEGGWCVQIALAVDGAVVLGVLDLPFNASHLAGVVGLGATLVDESGSRVLRPTQGRANTMIASSSARNHAALAELRRIFPEFTIATGSSVGVKVARMLAGEADCYIHNRSIHEWDVAAPAAVLLAAGGLATALDGSALRFNSTRSWTPGLVCSTRTDHAQLIARLAQAGITAQAHPSP